MKLDKHAAVARLGLRQPAGGKDFKASPLELGSAARSARGKQGRHLLRRFPRYSRAMDRPALIAPASPQ